ncbi:leukocyte elastase inhibitor-like, partial [Plectropomus leopardus]|uniref:leukocyte elastase inhibitor-like n=1 Tax=Plectropomus leopardus TaxID=160734 RepID=UPI001C4D75B0
KYLADSKKYYKAELEPVDFIKAFDAARIQINGWVEEQTKGNIKDLLAEGLLDDTTVLVLVNAIYFKGLWNNKFEKESTVDAEFRINKTETKTVKMMRQSGEFRLASIDEPSFQ